MTSRWADELAFTTDLARRAGEVLTTSYERLERIDYKSKRDVVTNADYASEHLVIDAIKDRYPDDAILAEESGEHAGVLRDDGSHNGRTWVIDPLDGTVNYANGIPFYCVSIGLVVDDRPAVGVIFDPARGDCYAATADGAARLNDEPIRGLDARRRCPTTSSAWPSSAVAGCMRERRIAPLIRIHRRMGSAALALAYVANGRFDAFVQNGGLSPWDVAAAGLIAERAGAVVTSLDGGPWWNPSDDGPRNSVVAAPPAQHAALLELLGARANDGPDAPLATQASSRTCASMPSVMRGGAPHADAAVPIRRRRARLKPADAELLRRRHLRVPQRAQRQLHDRGDLGVMRHQRRARGDGADEGSQLEVADRDPHVVEHARRCAPAPARGRPPPTPRAARRPRASRRRRPCHRAARPRRRGSAGRRGARSAA